MIWHAFVYLAAGGGLLSVLWLLWALVQDVRRPTTRRYQDHHWMTEEHNRAVRDAAVWNRRP